MIRYNQMCRDLVKFVDYAVPILLGTEQKIISIDSDWSSFFLPGRITFEGENTYLTNTTVVG